MSYQWGGPMSPPEADYPDDYRDDEWEEEQPPDPYDDYFFDQIHDEHGLSGLNNVEIEYEPPDV